MRYFLTRLEIIAGHGLSGKETRPCVYTVHGGWKHLVVLRRLAGHGKSIMQTKKSSGWKGKKKKKIDEETRSGPIVLCLSCGLHSLRSSDRTSHHSIFQEVVCKQVI